MSRTSGSRAARLVLSLRDSLGRAGTLSFARPKTVSLFGGLVTAK